MSESTKEDYFKALFNKEFPVNIEEIEDLPVKKRLMHLIHTTNEDGTQRPFKRFVAPDTSRSTTAALAPGLALTCAVDSKLNPFKDYTSVVTTQTSNHTTPLINTGKHSLGGQLIDSSPTTCQHCKLPKQQCLETLFGASMYHYFKKVATTKGVIYYGEKNDDEEDEEDERQPEKIVLDEFKRLLTQLKFAVAVMNGTSLPGYPENANNPYLLENSGCEDKPLPDCIVNGSYEKFTWWLEEQKAVHEWGYDMDVTDIPKHVVIFYREQFE